MQLSYWTFRHKTKPLGKAREAFPRAAIKTTFGNHSVLDGQIPSNHTDVIFERYVAAQRYRWLEAGVHLAVGAPRILARPHVFPIRLFHQLFEGFVILIA